MQMIVDDDVNDNNVNDDDHADDTDDDTHYTHLCNISFFYY